MARRSPDFLTGCLCCFCQQRIKWGDIVRMLVHKTDEEFAGYQELEMYSHTGCLRGVIHPTIALDYQKVGQPKVTQRPVPTNCSICMHVITDQELVLLRLQRPQGTVKKPTFAEQSVQVHSHCFAEARRVGVTNIK